MHLKEAIQRKLAGNFLDSLVKGMSAVDETVRANVGAPTYANEQASAAADAKLPELRRDIGLRKMHDTSQYSLPQFLYTLYSGRSPYTEAGTGVEAPRLERHAVKGMQQLADKAAANPIVPAGPQFDPYRKLLQRNAREYTPRASQRNAQRRAWWQAINDYSNDIVKGNRTRISEDKFQRAEDLEP